MAFFLLSLTGLQSQEAILTSGGNASGSGGTVSYSIGQTFYTTYMGANGSVSHGVQHPFETLNETTLMEYTKSMSSGWNWFSVYLVSENMGLDNMLGSLSPQVGDYIKDRKGNGNSSTYYDEGGFTGWFPALELDPKETYKMKLGNAGDLIYQGYPVDIANMEILVNAGWNWIGYPLSFEMPVSEFLITLDNVPDDYIKNQFVSTTFYDGIGWWGGLETMVLGEGYVIRVANAGSIHEPDQEPFKASTITTIEGIEIDFSRYSVNVLDFEFSGSATIEVFIDGNNAGAKDNILYAFNQDEVCVGINHGMQFPETNKYIYTLMMYSNVEEGDEIHFKFFDKEISKWYAYKEIMNFSYDMVIANAFQPFKLTNGIERNNKFNLNIYPNPFTNLLTINIETDDYENLTYQLYDINGRQLLNEKITNNNTNINMSQLPKAVYYLKIMDNHKPVKAFKIIKN